MMQFTNWLSPVTLRVLALALLHFLWQGAALAALAYVGMSMCRSASARYAVALATLVAMLTVPVGTYSLLQERGQDALSGASAEVLPIANLVSNPTSTRAKPQRTSEKAPAYFLWLVEAWFAGVVLLSLRSAGGFLVVERLRRSESTRVTKELLDRCLWLQRRIGLERAVRYCESLHLDAPAVAGWIRPVVLLPLAAITGLSDDELDAVIAHELAHIQRHDALVHMFQVGVETLLFYHPAVWWIGKRIRAERENCCDDMAVAVCGSPVAYANALTRMAEWKAAPQFVMAANRSPLVERIARVLGGGERESFRGANLTAGVLCLCSAVLAGSVLLGNAIRVHAQTPAPAPAAAPSSPTVTGAPSARAIPDTAFVVRPAEAPAPSAPAPRPSADPAPVAPETSGADPTPAPQAPPSAPKQSYIDSLKEAGLTNLSVDELIGLKVQGVTGEYVKEMKDLGVKMDADELIGMKVQGITPEYVKGMRAATGESLDSDALVGMKVQGVTPEYVRQMHDLGIKVDSDDIIGMKVQGITPEYVKEMRGLGLKLDSDDLIAMKVQGVTPEYVKSFQDLSLRPSTDELIGMKVQGVTAAYIKELQSAGLKVDIDDAIGAKVQGITPEWITKVRSHGFKDLTLEKLIQLKNLGVMESEK